MFKAISLCIHAWYFWLCGYVHGLCVAMHVYIVLCVYLCTYVCNVYMYVYMCVCMIIYVHAWYV